MLAATSTAHVTARHHKKYIFSTPVPPQHSPNPSFAPRLPAASSTSSQRLQNEPKSVPSARSTASPSSHEHALSPTRTTNTPFSQPSERYQQAELHVSERWLEPPVVVPELLRPHVDDLHDAEMRGVAFASRNTHPSNKPGLATGEPSHLHRSARAPQLS